MHMTHTLLVMPGVHLYGVVDSPAGNDRLCLRVDTVGQVRGRQGAILCPSRTSCVQCIAYVGVQPKGLNT